jgi:SAM-dependent methyltransferase
VTKIAEVERYWDARPCNVRHSTAPAGTVQWSADVTWRRYHVEPHIVDFAQFPRWKDKHVLEVGCGIGTDTLEFARAGAIVHAVDLSSESVNLACSRLWDQRWPNPELRNVSIRTMDAEQSLPSVEWGYDLAWAFGVLHHTPNPKRIVWNVFQRLKLGGEFRLMLYAKWSLKNLLGGQYEAQGGCPIVDKYTARSVRRLLEPAGFKVLSIRKRHLFRWRVADYVRHRYVERLGYRMLPMEALDVLEMLVGEHLLVVARKEIPSQERPTRNGLERVFA